MTPLNFTILILSLIGIAYVLAAVSLIDNEASIVNTAELSTTEDLGTHLGGVGGGGDIDYVYANSSATINAIWEFNNTLSIPEDNITTESGYYEGSLLCGNIVGGTDGDFCVDAGGSGYWVDGGDYISPAAATPNVWINVSNANLTVQGNISTADTFNGSVLCDDLVGGSDGNYCVDDVTNISYLAIVDYNSTNATYDDYVSLNSTNNSFFLNNLIWSSFLRHDDFNTTNATYDDYVSLNSTNNSFFLNDFIWASFLRHDDFNVTNTTYYVNETNASTECTGSNVYLSGDGTCETDQDGSGNTTAEIQTAINGSDSELDYLSVGGFLNITNTTGSTSTQYAYFNNTAREFYSTVINSTDWTNVTITESQVSDLNHANTSYVLHTSFNTTNATYDDYVSLNSTNSSFFLNNLIWSSFLRHDDFNATNTTYDDFVTANFSNTSQNLDNQNATYYLLCDNIVGGTDSDFCVDASGSGSSPWIDEGDYISPLASTINVWINGSGAILTVQGNISTVDSFNGSLICDNLVGGTDSDFCVDADTVTGNTSIEISNVAWNITDNIIFGTNKTYNIGNSTFWGLAIYVRDLFIETLITGSQIASGTITSDNILDGTIGAIDIASTFGNTTAEIRDAANDLDFMVAGDINSSQIEDGTIGAIDISSTFGNTTLEITNTAWNVTDTIQVGTNTTFDLGNTTFWFDEAFLQTLHIATLITNVQIQTLDARKITGLINASQIDWSLNSTTETLDAVNNTLLWIDHANDTDRLEGQLPAFYQNLDNQVTGDINTSQIEANAVTDAEVANDITIISTSNISTSQSINISTTSGFYYNGTCTIIENFGGSQLILC